MIYKKGEQLFEGMVDLLCLMLQKQGIEIADEDAVRNSVLSVEVDESKGEISLNLTVELQEVIDEKSNARIH